MSSRILILTVGILAFLTGGANRLSSQTPDQEVASLGVPLLLSLLENLQVRSHPSRTSYVTAATFRGNGCAVRYSFATYPTGMDPDRRGLRSTRENGTLDFIDLKNAFSIGNRARWQMEPLSVTRSFLRDGMLVEQVAAVAREGSMHLNDSDDADLAAAALRRLAAICDTPERRAQRQARASHQQQPPASRPSDDSGFETIMMYLMFGLGALLAILAAQ